MAAPVVDRGLAPGWLAPDALVALVVLAVLVLATTGIAVGVLAVVPIVVVLAGLGWARRHRRQTAPWWHDLAEQRAALARLRHRHHQLDAGTSASSAATAELAVALAGAERSLERSRALARSLDRATLAQVLTRRPVPDAALQAAFDRETALALQLSHITEQIDRCESERTAALAAAHRELDLIDRGQLAPPA